VALGPGAHVYSRWDGTQDPDPFSPDDVFDALTDDLLAAGDPLEAIRRALEHGLQLERGERLDGLAGLLRRLATLRQSLAGPPELIAKLEALDEQLRAALGDQRIDGVDAELARALLGDSAVETLRRLGELEERLVRGGYLVRDGQALRLTSAGVRRIGERALGDLFAELRPAGRGRHGARWPGIGGDPIEETKRYDFGEPFLLDAQRTLMNALRHGPPGRRVRVLPDDVEVFRTESTTRCATVLLLDASRSMLLRGCFVAAKKVAIALETLIRCRFPGDALWVVAFADRARELPPEALPYLDARSFGYGTNLQDGLRQARRLLGRHGATGRQIVLITDGEPTAYLDGDTVRFSYPPTFQTVRATLREVGACARQRIMISTFMLDHSQHLVEFVNQMNRAARGRAFFSQPDELGRYVLVDFLTQRRRRVG
jgi:uncharacterized protein with von Willebrand factor type A (vWA) domain